MHAQLYTQGSVDTLLVVAHLAKTKNAHQMTLCALNILLHNVDQEYSGRVTLDGDPQIISATDNGA